MVTKGKCLVALSTLYVDCGSSGERCLQPFPLTVVTKVLVTCAWIGPRSLLFHLLLRLPDSSDPPFSSVRFAIFHKIWWLAGVLRFWWAIFWAVERWGLGGIMRNSMFLCGN